MKPIKIFIPLLLFVANTSFAATTQDQIDTLKKRLEALETKQSQKNQSMVDEISNIKTHSAVPEMATKGFAGLGNGASKVYYSKSPLSIGGYGEIKFTSERSGNDVTDVHRFVPYIGYRFSDNLVFNSEIEFEHGGIKGGGDTSGTANPTYGEAIIEFAYLDFLIQQSLNIRVGHILAPVGLSNQRHEPTLFNAVERPEVEKYIIPSTWHDNGVLVHGETPSVRYSVGMMAGFDQTGFDKKNWVRGGRQGGAGSKTKSDDFAYVGRVEYVGAEGLSLGASTYMGKSAQTATGTPDGDVAISALHGEWEYSGMTIRGLYTMGQIEDGELISSGIGEKVSGYYLTLAYDFMPLISSSANSAFVGFVRHSDYNLQEEMASGVTKDETLERTRTTIGINYKPVANVVLKADYQMRKNKSAEENDKFAMGLGFVF